MPFFILSIIVQVAFAIHVIKTGRDQRWLYLILVFPLVGCLVYLIMEVLPDIRRSNFARRSEQRWADTVDPDRGMREVSQRLDQSQNIDNVVAFAEECVATGRLQEAIEAYRSALSGQFEYDAKLMLGLARAYFDADDPQATIETLDSLIEHNPEFRSADGHLLYARSMEALGRTDEARHEYEALAEYYPGPEAKCRYGLLLKSLGELSLANSQFRDISRTASSSPVHYQRLHREWIEIANSHL